jgi:hypothetical protein
VAGEDHGSSADHGVVTTVPSLLAIAQQTIRLAARVTPAILSFNMVRLTAKDLPSPHNVHTDGTYGLHLRLV